MSRYTEQELRDTFFNALDFFNDALDSGITRENTVLAFFTPDNGLAVYERFCRRYFPKHLDEDYKAEGYFQSFAAQAFAGGGRYGVMVRADMDIPCRSCTGSSSMRSPICSAGRTRSRAAASSTATAWAAGPRTA